MAAPIKFDSFANGLGTALIDISSDDFTLVLCATEPDAANDVVFADLDSIAAMNGYPADGIPLTSVTFTQFGSNNVMGADDVDITPAGGGVGPWQFPVLWDKTADRVVAYWDAGVGITIPNAILFPFVWTTPNQVLYIT